MVLWDELLHNGYKTPIEMITRMHYEENLTIDEMAEKLGISHNTLKRKIAKEGIKMKKRGGLPYSKMGKRS